ncbi:MAG: Alanine--tRNA ligase [Candidatus Moanabacter tarae]|uniref:Alanine--tRNA ligase n=1 Tax=Candidatus Moanibacter tarae TaxID=2200854 RepID=A0A2Z4AC30_9BACT|nr:MAG: Alanine--tRNA ligase [Candidatus Moanabacter tarae]|tara:strand:- start:2038 stop:4713 length:2676 start_codon:yes stop_codon:yes gene_type:complete
MKSNDLRKSFLDFFRSKEHEIVPSASLLPDSPNLLFTNAGMNQFVPFFLGERSPAWTRVADTQKCIRAGGKHNDLEDVGFDTYHQTFFEMLGNWSFGDYFKKEAIEWSWELLTEVWKLPKRRLYATIYKPGHGDPSEFDQEASDIWSEIFIHEKMDPSIHIRHFDSKDNFWMMGDTGPCGPNSEIHIDLTPDGDTLGMLVNTDSVRCIEIWNLVFIQFNAESDGSFNPLEKKHIDTGLGFERVSGIYASTKGLSDFSQPVSNYNCDLFSGVFEELTKLSNHRYQGTIPKRRNQMSNIEAKDCAFRVLADHIRALSFSIADGILPGNEGRNYVLRRILRRAILFSDRVELPKGSFVKLVEPLISQFSDVFPELKKGQGLISQIISSEEEKFQRTIERGLTMFEKITSGGKTKISGGDAFTLYDTYGFPLDLTQIIARERGISIDQKGFEAQMLKQRERARSAQEKIEISVFEGENVEIEETEFIGFDPVNFENCKVNITTQVHQNNENFLVFDRTPFYPEKGGQVGDSGFLKVEGIKLRISDTVRDPQGRTLHQIEAGNLKGLEGKEASLHIDVERRKSIQRHHTATHILHWALRSVLGSHVSQAGSLVADDRLRFDFSHFEQISQDLLNRIEAIANRRILENAGVGWYEIPFDQKPKDILAFFGEKYGSIVRVVDIGGWSIELCGGTHVTASGEIGLLKIVSESGIAAGTRRIEAQAGDSAFNLVVNNFSLLSSLSNRLSCSPQELEDRISSLLQQKNDLEMNLRKFRQKETSSVASELIDHSIEIQGINIIIAKIDVKSQEEMRGLAFSISKTFERSLIVLGSSSDSKVTLLAVASPEANDKGHIAHEIVRNLCGQLGGRGGGKPDFAMGGGDCPEKLEKVLESFRDSLN